MPNSQTVRVETEIGGRTLAIESGEIGRQANGSALVRLGDTMVMAAAVADKRDKEGLDFFPLTVDYREKFYAAGKIPGGFFKREGRPTEKEIVTCRLIDRPLRPLFEKGFVRETQLINSVLSFDGENEPDILAVIASSTAVVTSDIPFLRPVGAVRVGLVDGQLLLNPTLSQLEASDLNLALAGTADNITMVEGGGLEVPEERVLEALRYGHEAIQRIVAIQEEMRAKVGRRKMIVKERQVNAAFAARVRELAMEKIREALLISGKLERQEAIDEIQEKVLEQLMDDEFEDLGEIHTETIIAFQDIERQEIRRMIMERGKRADGRGLADIRPIGIVPGFLPRTHGSALFTRGETQALVTCTLGTSMDEQMVDNLEGRDTKRFLLHYNFPSFSVGEVKPIRGPGRREIGHGALAERAIRSVLPAHEEFPYTIRVVSDILESNGSSSMATVSGASLALMDAGVPLREHVAGIAMGLIQEGGEAYILSDILGLEDHAGDMDFKVAGTRQGITGIQMDVKVAGLSLDTVARALAQAREGRLFILDQMDGVLAAPRAQLSPYAPRMFIMKVPSDKVRDVIGPGGKIIRGIIEQTGVTIDIDDDGTIHIASVDEAAGKEAMAIISRLTEEAEVGKVYVGKVKKITDFGAFVEIIPGTDGLLHISQLANYRVKRVSDVINEGDEVVVKVTEIDRQGKIKLSRKEVLADQEPKS